MKTNFDAIDNFDFRHLVTRIRDAVQYHARTIPKFTEEKNGCIGIWIEPLSVKAATWIGNNLHGHEPGKVTEPCWPLFVYHIDSDGSFESSFPAINGGVEIVNCFGYASLKLAALTLWEKATKNPNELIRRYQAGELTERNGYALDRGSAYVTVYIEGLSFIRVYVVVSGAESEEDELCAIGGAEAIARYCDGVEGAIKHMVNKQQLERDAVLHFRTSHIIVPNWSVLEDEAPQRAFREYMEPLIL